MTTIATASEIAYRVRAGELHAADVAAAALVRAHDVQRSTNAFVTIADDQALARADEVAELLVQGADLPLAGVPVVVKDNICTAGIRSTAASRSLADFVPPYSATVVARLETAGAIVIGKANCDEFGMGSSNENSAYGPVRNPWDGERVPGGSSGGSAVAVAAGVVPLALGTDTGGSVRQPASFTGVIGYKPTYGFLSRYGVMSYASSLDQVGILARSTADVRLAMRAMSGRDPLDATSVDAADLFVDAGVPDGRLAGANGSAGARSGRAREGREEMAAEEVAVEDLAAGDLGVSLAGLRVGVVRELAGEGNSPGVLTALDRVQTTLGALGAVVSEVSLAHARYGVPTYYLVATAEASSNLSRYDGTIYGARVGGDALGHAGAIRQTRGASLGREVQRRILMGTFALSAGYYQAYYGKALSVRRVIAEEISGALEHVDVLLTPTAPTVAFGLGERLDDPLAMYVGDVDSCLANLAGIGAISVPAGSGDDDLPCGVQFMAATARDDVLWRVSEALERSAGPAFAPLAPAAAPAR